MYTKLSFEKSRAILAGEAEIVFVCPTVNCPNIVIVSVTHWSYTCTQCEKTYCPQCQRAVHLKMTCTQYFEHLQAEQRRLHQQRLDADEKATDDYFRNLPGKKYRQCYKCKVWIERTHGCKYMTCLSPTCQGKTYFCMECERALASKHEEHKCLVKGYAFL